MEVIGFKTSCVPVLVINEGSDKVPLNMIETTSVAMSPTSESVNEGIVNELV